MEKYSLSPEAEEDLTKIYFWGFEQWGTVQADKYLNNFYDRFEQIADQPYLYPAVDFIHEGYRRSVCGGDNIFYRIESNGVEIMRILGRQDTDQIL